MVRLGAGGLDGRALTPRRDAGGALQALSKFDGRLADSHGRRRDHRRRHQRHARSRERRRLPQAHERRRPASARASSPGTEEGATIHRAAVYGVDHADGRGVVIDIGGGSVEIHARRRRLRCGRAKSFKIGVIRLTERFVRTDPLTERDERRLVGSINQGDRRPRRSRSSGAASSASSARPARSLSLGGVVLQAESGVRGHRPAQLPRAQQGRCTGCASGWSTPICLRSATLAGRGWCG